MRSQSAGHSLTLICRWRTNNCIMLLPHRCICSLFCRICHLRKIAKCWKLRKKMVIYFVFGCCIFWRYLFLLHHHLHHHVVVSVEYRKCLGGQTERLVWYALLISAKDSWNVRWLRETRGFELSLAVTRPPFESFWKEKRSLNLRMSVTHWNVTFFAEVDSDASLLHPPFRHSVRAPTPPA